MILLSTMTWIWIAVIGISILGILAGIIDWYLGEYRPF